MEAALPAALATCFSSIPCGNGRVAPTNSASKQLHLTLSSQLRYCRSPWYAQHCGPHTVCSRKHVSVCRALMASHPLYMPSLVGQVEQPNQRRNKNASNPPALTTSSVYEWSGLKSWRAKGVDKGRSWGDAGPSQHIPAPRAQEYQHVQLAGSLVECAVQVLRTACPYGKAALTHRAWVAYNAGGIPLHPADLPCISILMTGEATANGIQQHDTQSTCQQGTATATEVSGTGVQHVSNQQQGSQPSVIGHRQWQSLPTRPARMERPQLVAPKMVPSYERGESPMTSLSAHMLHNLAHIELNAIDLAWDTVARWAGLRLPAAFYEDFARVADDEGRHLGWCLQRLEELGHAYGDMPAHDLLWEGCAASAGSLTGRLAVVPMSQEARGLDAGQRLVGRLTGAGDKRTAAIVAKISDEEHAHVAVGVAWYKRICAALDVQALPLFHQHLATLGPDLLKGPFHHHAREKVGLSRAFYDINLWPAESLAGMATPAVAAAQRGRGTPLASVTKTSDIPPRCDDTLTCEPATPDGTGASSVDTGSVNTVLIPPLPACTLDQIASTWDQTTVLAVAVDLTATDLNVDGGDGIGNGVDVAQVVQSPWTMHELQSLVQLRERLQAIVTEEHGMTELKGQV